MFQLSKIIFVCLLLALTSCKTLKIDANSKLTKSSSVNEVLAIHNIKEFKFNTLQSRVKTNYDDGRKSVSPSMTLRIEKDKKIWLSAKFLGFTVAKIFITPNRFSFYEKLNKRYYDGDLSALANFLGQEVSFKQIQNLFLGQSIIELREKNLKAKVLDNQIALKSLKENSNYNLEILFYILNAKVSAYKASKNNQSLSVAYKAYQKVNNQDFPEFMQIKYGKAKVLRSVEMNFRSVTIDEELSFPYTVPKGYTKFKFRK